MKHQRRLPPLKTLHTIFDYNPATGHLIYRIKTSPRTNIGQVAGFINKSDGQLMVNVQSTAYQASRIAWFLYYKKDPYGKKIYHRDNNPLNNNIENLCASCQTGGFA